jgi:putative hydrolase of the HAD superfamily
MASERYHTAAKMGKKACSPADGANGPEDARDMDDSVGRFALRSRPLAWRAFRCVAIVPMDVLCFDAVGTLFTTREPIGVTYARHGTRHGLRLDPARLEAGFRTAFGAAPPLAFPDATADDLERHERAWWHRVVSQTFAAAGNATLPQGLFEDLFAHYGTAAAWRCFDETRSALTTLRGRGHRLCIISNFDSRLPPLAAALGLSDVVDAIITSTGARAAKPAPAIFRAALVMLGVPPAAALHVGDDPSADVDGALAAGMRAVLIKRGGGPTRAMPSGVPVIESLADLGNVIRR